MNKKLFKNKYFLTGGTVIMILLLLCFFAPVLTKYSYSDINLTNINKGPSLKHLLGTDELGRDVWTRILYGGRVSVTVGIVATAVQMFIGITLGLTAGYKGGIFDFIIMRIIDIIMCFPMFLAAIAISSVIGQSFINLILIISLLSWTEVARVVRAETLSLKTRDFVTASKVSGFSEYFFNGSCGNDCFDGNGNLNGVFFKLFRLGNKRPDAKLGKFNIFSTKLENIYKLLVDMASCGNYYNFVRIKYKLYRKSSYHVLFSQ